MHQLSSHIDGKLNFVSGATQHFFVVAWEGSLFVCCVHVFLCFSFFSICISYMLDVVLYVKIFWTDKRLVFCLFSLCL